MTNPRNLGNVIGRVSQDIKTFSNSDGSQSLAITIAVDDDYKSGADKTVKTNFIPVRDYVRAGGVNPWERVHKGDLIAVPVRINAKPFEKDGVTQYPVTIEADGFPAFLESKAVTEARAAKNTVEAAAGEPVATGVPTSVEGDPAAAAQIAQLEAQLAAARNGATVDSPFGA